MKNHISKVWLGLVLACLLPACGGGGGGDGAAAPSGPPVSLARTGQVTSYATDDDGALQVGAAWPSPRFVTSDCGTPADNTDDVVTDNLTGLMWVRNHGGATTRTWQQSLDYANALSLCGFSDWRLANVLELESLLLNGSGASNTYLTGQGFLLSQSGFWSSTTLASHSNRAWSVDVFGGVSEFPKTSTAAAWAVRGTANNRLARTGQTTCYDAAGTVVTCVATGQDGEWQAGVAWPATRFSLNTCGTPADTTDDIVTDNVTGLSWTRKADWAARDWTGVLSDASGLTLCGFSDWRVANQRELRSLVNHEQGNAGTWLVSQGFENVQAANTTPCYWTSTSSPLDPANRATCTFFFQGLTTIFETKVTAHNVLPVRGGR